MIQSRLNNGKFEEWKVELTVLEEKAIVDLSYSNRYIFNPSLTSWFNIKDHCSQTLIILFFLFCNLIACNWLSCDLQFMAAYRWLCCLLYYERNLQPSDWLIGKVLISHWLEVAINWLVFKNSFSHTRTINLKTCKNNYTI